MNIGNGENIPLVRLAKMYTEFGRELHKRSDRMLRYYIEMAEMELAAFLARDAKRRLKAAQSVTGNETVCASEGQPSPPTAGVRRRVRTAAKA